jgi:SAM-dependent methyltransferase
MKICSCCNNHVTYKPLIGYYENLQSQGFPYSIDDLEFLNLEEYMCTSCGSSDRDRFIAFYIDSIKKDYKQVLHISPSYPLNNFIKSKFDSVTTGDLYMDNVDIKLDLCNMSNIADESYDLVICSHVLEHVDDDKAAINEIYRVLKVGGQAILLVPICLSLKGKDEDLNTNELERTKRFGQSDHVRLYGKQSFQDLLKSTNGKFSEINASDYKPNHIENLGLKEKNTLYILEK